MWAPLIELVGGDEADVQRLLLDPLNTAIADRLPAHLARTTPAEIWRWVAERKTETIFTPVIEGLS